MTRHSNLEALGDRFHRQQKPKSHPGCSCLGHVNGDLCEGVLFNGRRLCHAVRELDSRYCKQHSWMERVNGGGSGATNPFSKKEETKMMEQIRNLNLDRIDLDDAVGMLAFANVVSATYAEMKMEPPAWFTDKRGSLSGYVEQRRKENLTKAAKEIKAELNKLKTAEEKRSELNARLKEIEAAMASK